jgi:hypothetical protein
MTNEEKLRFIELAKQQHDFLTKLAEQIGCSLADQGLTFALILCNGPVSAVQFAGDSVSILGNLRLLEHDILSKHTPSEPVSCTDEETPSSTD